MRLWFSGGSFGTTCWVSGTSSLGSGRGSGREEGKKETKEVNYPGIPVAQGDGRVGGIIRDFGEVLRG